MSNQCFFPLCTPQKAICPLTVLLSTVYSPKSHITLYSAFFHCTGWYGFLGSKQHCKGAYGFLGSTQWKKALIAHLLPKKPPSRKSHQLRWPSSWEPLWPTTLHSGKKHSTIVALIVENALGATPGPPIAWLADINVTRHIWVAMFKQTLLMCTYSVACNWWSMQRCEGRN